MYITSTLLTMFIWFISIEHNRSDTNHFYIVHEDSGLFACAKGRPTKEATWLRLEGPKQIEDDLKSMREDFLMNKKSQMLVMI